MSGKTKFTVLFFLFLSISSVFVASEYFLKSEQQPTQQTTTPSGEEIGFLNNLVKCARGGYQCLDADSPAPFFEKKN